MRHASIALPQFDFFANYSDAQSKCNKKVWVHNLFYPIVQSPEKVILRNTLFELGPNW